MTGHEYIRPEDIEKRSFEIIADELAQRNIVLDSDKAHVIMRAIHTTADFDYAHNLRFSENVIEKAEELLRSGAVIITDTNMALSGINKTALSKLGCEARCFMADDEVRKISVEKGITRAAASIEKASRIKDRPLIFASGNAPTFLIKLCEYADSGLVEPSLIIAMPVGFVNVEYSKELVTQRKYPYIAAMGRKGGSNVTASVVNALMYKITRGES